MARKVTRDIEGNAKTGGKKKAVPRKTSAAPSSPKATAKAAPKAASKAAPKAASKKPTAKTASKPAPKAAVAKRGAAPTAVASPARSASGKTPAPKTAPKPASKPAPKIASMSASKIASKKASVKTAPPKKAVAGKAAPQSRTNDKAPAPKATAKVLSRKPVAPSAPSLPAPAPQSTFGLNPAAHGGMRPKAVYTSIKPISSFREDGMVPRDFDRVGCRLPANPMTVKALRPIAREQMVAALQVEHDSQPEAPVAAQSVAAERISPPAVADTPSDTAERAVPAVVAAVPAVSAAPAVAAMPAASPVPVSKAEPEAVRQAAPAPKKAAVLPVPVEREKVPAPVAPPPPPPHRAVAAAHPPKKSVVEDSALQQIVRSAQSDLSPPASRPRKAAKAPPPVPSVPETEASGQAGSHTKEKTMISSQPQSSAPITAAKEPVRATSSGGAGETALRETDGDNSLLALMMRDPSSIFIYWFLEPETLRKTAETLGEEAMRAGAWVLRLTRLENNLTVTIPVDVAANRHYAVVEPHSTYVGELGFRHPGGYVSVLRGNTVSTPRLTISEHVDPTWSTSYEELLRLMALGQYRAPGGDAERAFSEAADQSADGGRDTSLEIVSEEGGLAGASVAPGTRKEAAPQTVAVGPLSSMTILKPGSGVNLAERAERLRMSLAAPLSSHVLGGASSFSFLKDMNKDKGASGK